MDLDDTLCYCFHISQRKVVNYLRVHRPKVASQLTGCGGAGTGCGWCVPFLKRLFEQSQAVGVQPLGYSSSEEDSLKAGLQQLTAAEYAQQRAAYIRAGKGKPAAGALPLPDEPPPLESSL
ncbi:MAG: (2Fe-2S)-binding protein [Planctomycetaceae bacterium]|nr:(2Fe-2S)-binding protein [Planctomycetaceae bacterium]